MIEVEECLEDQVLEEKREIVDLPKDLVRERKLGRVNVERVKRDRNLLLLVLRMLHSSLELELAIPSQPSVILHLLL